MALNKFMHPGNIYKTPPNFANLAKQFKEFSSIAKVEVTGKVSIDFKDPNALRILTKCLLKSDFSLDVSIPEDRLVPTLPLRLNYILWIEDILKSIQMNADVYGIDIGTGACAIYPLLAAVKNKWHMVGTDTDDTSLKIAEENISRNNLQNLISLKTNPSNTVVEHLLKEDEEKNFDFCMCNPPFYSNVQELCESRSPARPPPKNGFTGSPQELITEGGELTFCRKLIEESKQFQDRVSVYTTMVGHKYNLKQLEQDLQAEGINHTTTEFCQGRVTRWGLAWTYKDFDLQVLAPPRKTSRKTSTPMIFLLPKIDGCEYSLDIVAEKLKYIMDDLKITYKIVDRKGGFCVCFDTVATENTWSNQRRKRRLIKQQLGEPKKTKCNSPDILDPLNQSFTTSKDIEETTTNIKQNNNVEMLITNGLKQCSSDSKPIVIHAFVKLSKSKDDYLMETEFLEGSAGKEGLHQIVQFIKNNWK